MSSQPEENAATPRGIEIAGQRFEKSAYEPPTPGTMYCVRDKAVGERIIVVIEVNADETSVVVDTIDDGKRSSHSIQISVDMLARQATKGWCSTLKPVDEPAPAAQEAPSPADAPSTIHMRLDSQNFGRCCADIARANLRFSTQLIKDVGDGPFRAGDFEKAFLTFEQLAPSFNSVVAASRRTIADGRRQLIAEKGKLSGKEIQERTAAYIRSEQQIQTAEREFNAILEGLRMYLRASQG
jgi:hypothetical protein